MEKPRSREDSAVAASGPNRAVSLLRRLQQTNRLPAVLLVRMLALQRLQKRDDLPPLRLRQLGPHRHAAAHHSVGHHPEERARWRLLHFPPHQAGRSLRSSGFFSVAFRAVLLVEFPPRGGRLRIGLQRIPLPEVLLWN